MVGKDQKTLLEILKSLGFCQDEGDLYEYWPRVRDNQEIRVLKSKSSGIIILSQTSQGDIEFYRTRGSYGDLPGVDEKELADRSLLIKRKLPHLEKRLDMVTPFIQGKSWLDVGAGSGGLIELVQQKLNQNIFFNGPNKIMAVEPCIASLENLIAAGIDAVENINDVTSKFDVITLMHVLEHLPDPMSFLLALNQTLNTNGRILIEVPHARDVLIETYDCDDFKDFTFWSEHLMLHTRESLQRMLIKSGFTNIQIKPVQRHGVANHLYWLRNGKPGGQNVWSFLNDPELDNLYEKILASHDKTDTLFAYAQKKD